MAGSKLYVNSEETNRIEEVLDSDISYPSKPVTVIDIPEVSSVEAEFFYNFFVRNESSNSDGRTLFIDPQTTPSYDRKFLEASETFPRMIRISWAKPEFSEKVKNFEFFKPGEPVSELPPDELTSIENRLRIKDYIDDVLFEESITNGTFSAVHIKDVDMNERLYELAEGAKERFSPENLWLVVTNEAGNNSAFKKSSFVDSSQPLSEKTIQALGHMNTAGILARDEKTLKLADTTFFGPKSVEINLSANNLFIGSLMRGSAEGSIGIFSEEVRKLAGQANASQNAAVASASPGTVSPDDYLTTIRPVEVFGPQPTSDSANGARFDERSILAGYYVEKSEVTSKGKVIHHDPIILEDQNLTSFIDTKVKYGSVYKYRVRCVALTQFEALSITGVTSTGVFIARALIASRGKIGVVSCLDKIPPPPPDDITFVYNYERDNLMFSWGFPVNPQQDIKKFQIFRRQSLLEPFVLIAQYDFDDSVVKYDSGERLPADLNNKMRSGLTFYIDDDFDKDRQPQYIYAACCIDAHGLSSNYSEQFKLSFDPFKNKIISQYVSPAGAPKPYPNLYIVEDLFQDAIKTSEKTRVSVFLDPEYYEVFDEEGNNLDVLVRDSENPSYFMTALNCDLQQSKIVEIHVSDKQRRESESVHTVTNRNYRIQTLPIAGSTPREADVMLTKGKKGGDLVDWAQLFDSVSSE